MSAEPGRTRGGRLVDGAVGLASVLAAALLGREELPHPLRLVLGGLVLGVWAWAALGVGSALARRCDPEARPIARALSSALWALGFVVALASLAGALGSLALLPVAIAHALALVAAGPPRLPSGLRSAPADLRRAAARDPALAILVVLSIGALGLLLGRTTLAPIYQNDDLSYHASLPFEWLQQGTLARIFLPFGNHSPPYYPKNIELVFTWALLALRDLGPLTFVQGGALGLLALALAALARELGASRRAAVAAASLALLQPSAIPYLPSLYVDTAFAAFTVAGVWALVRLVERFDSGRALELALALALLLGTKVLGVFYLVAVLAPLCALLLFLRRPRSTAPRLGIPAALAILVVLMACGGWWYARNLIQTGNPIFPLLVEVGGRTLLDGAYDRSDLPSGTLKGLLSLFVPRPGEPPDLATFLCLTPFALGALVTLLRSPNAPLARRVLLLGLALPAWIGFAVTSWVPFGYPRFAYAAHALATLSLLPAIDSRPRLSRVMTAVCLLPWLTAAAASRQREAILLSPALQAVVGSPLVWLGTIVGAALVALAALLLTVRLRPHLRLAAQGSVALLALVGIQIASVTSDPGGPHVHPSARELWAPHVEIEQRYGPARIASTGTTWMLFAYGWRGRNHVRYVHVDAPGEALFHERVRALRDRRAVLREDRTGHGYYRAEPDPKAWLANLRAQRIEILVCARLPHWILRRPEYHRDPQGFPLEDTWAQERPELFRPIHSSRNVRAYQLLGQGP